MICKQMGIFVSILFISGCNIGGQQGEQNITNSYIGGNATNIDHGQGSVTLALDPASFANLFPNAVGGKVTNPPANQVKKVIATATQNNDIITKQNAQNCLNNLASCIISAIAPNTSN